MSDALLDLVAEMLEEDPADIPVTENLFEMGLQSIALMRLVSHWRDQGYEIDFAMLAEAPTLEAWNRLLTGNRRQPDGGQRTGHHEEPPGNDPENGPENGTAHDGENDIAHDRENARDEFDLALLQHAYWVGRDSRQRLGGVAPHLYLEFDGAGVDPARLEAAFDRLSRRHEMLRVRIGDNGEQRIQLPGPWRRLQVHDLRECGPAETEQRLALIREEMSHELLDIEHGEVFRAALSLLPPTPGRDRAPTRLHLDVDMVAADAVSYRVMLADLARFYDDPKTDPAPLTYTYREYLRARPDARRERKHRAADYWRQRLPDLPEPPDLPVARDPGERARAVRLALSLDSAERAALTGAARRRGVTPATAVLTAFSEVVGAWSARSRFLINVPMFDREQVHPDVDNLVGDFTSSVLLDVDLSENLTFVERARRVQRRLHADAAHKDYSGVEVLRDLSRRSGEQVIAPVVFTSGLDLGELFTEQARRCFGDPVWIISQGPQVMLDAQVSEIDGGLLVNWDVRENEFADGVPAAMFAAFERLVRAVARDEAWDAPVGDLLPAGQRATRLRVNSTAAPGTGALLHQRFFEHAGERAARPAGCGAGGATLSHDELADLALRVAAGLRERGVRPADPVAVTLPRGPDQVLAVLGVLAAGGTYVPVGVEQPPARAGRIASVAGYRFVIATASSATDSGAAAGVSRLTLPELLAGDPLPAPIEVPAEQPAYLLFTSGSTGEPKGVEVPHRAATNTLDDLVERFRLGPLDRTLAVSALDFDLSVFDIFAMLGAGGAVVTLAEGDHRNAHHWAELIREHGVSVLNCVPALLDALLRTELDLGTSLRQVLLGGDWVGADLPGRLRARVPHCRFAGLGGTTETAIHSTICEVDEVPPSWRSVPYGTPLRNVRLRVVDQLGRDAPDWVPGELWIGGAGVALGYRGDPERTRDRFVTVHGIRWYRTGDLARYWPDGTVEFLGRRDNQVKVNGFRIELGEVETALLNVPGVRSAVAVVTGRAGASLAAAVLTEDGVAEDGVDRDRIRAELARSLPAHMIPQTIVGLDAVPLTANGKVDRAAVRRLAEEATGPDPDEPVAASSPLEQVITLVWQSVLGRDRIDATQSLFAVGGDSVLATVIVARLREALDTDEVSVRMVFSTPTITGLAQNMLATATDPGRLQAVAEIYLEVEAMSEDEALREIVRAEGS